MLPHEYIRFRLTGECMTDVTSASSMQLLKCSKKAMAGELFSALDLDRSIVAPLCECIETVGRTTQEIQELTGIPKGIPVIAGGGDSVVSAIGTGVIRRGVVLHLLELQESSVPIQRTLNPTRRPGKHLLQCCAGDVVSHYLQYYIGICSEMAERKFLYC